MTAAAAKARAVATSCMVELPKTRGDPHDTRALTPYRPIVRSMTSDSSRPPATPSVTAEGETFTSAPKRLRYAEVEAPAPGKSVPIAPRVRWGRIPLPMDLNHINIWLVETEEGCVAVDTGMAVAI